MASRLRSALFLISVYAAFFASGAASLIAEVTWNRMLIVVVGNSLSAAAMIIVVFMGGLGLGSWLGGRVFGPRRSSLVPYLVLETAVGLYVLASPALFDALAALFTRLAGSIDDRAGLTLVRLVVSLAALLLPATLMGATFPAMISGAAPRDPAKRTGRTGYLYSINTVGAAVGCFAAGYHLLFELGVRFTLTVAFCLYVFAALAALVASRLGSPAAGRADDVASAARAAEATPRGDRGLRRFLVAATFGIGFVALAYEVLLTRLAILYLGNSVSVFPLVLTAFLLGTGISAVAGTWAWGRLRGIPRGDRRLFGTVALGAGAFVLATPYVLLTDWVLKADQFARFADAVPRDPLPILGIIVAPTILLGALLPIAIRMLQPERLREATQSAATLYAFNTAGGLLGAGLVNHFLVPHIGIHGAVVLLTAVCVAVGLGSLLSGRRRAGATAVAAAVVVAAVLALALPPTMGLYAAKIAESTRARSTDVKLVLEGRAATVTVLDQDDPSLGTYRDMYLNGVEEASTRYWHAQLFKLLGILPPLVHESTGPGDALVIAFGAGITAGSVLASEDVASLDVVDLNPDVERINDLFTDVNGDVFHRPRFRFHNDDGRNYLVTCGRTYDLIISDSTHPRAYDSWILYTEEFYRSVRERLRPGGIFAQWVPVLHSMRGALFRIHLNTFRTVFPNTTFWYVPGSDQAFLLATPEPFSVDTVRLQQRLDRLPGWFRAEEYQLDTVERIAGFFWMDAEAMAAMIGDETRINTDDFHYFDKQSAVWPGPPETQLPRFQASAAPYFTPADAARRESIELEQRVAGHLARYAFFGSRPDLDAAYCLAPGNGNARWFLRDELAGTLPDPETFCEDEEVRKYREALAHHPDDPFARNALADALATAGRLEEARKLAEEAVAAAPDNGMILDTLGWILFRQGQPAEALDVLTRAAVDLPDHPIVLYHLGVVQEALGRRAEARASLEKAVSSPRRDFPEVLEAIELLRRLE